MTRLKRITLEQAENFADIRCISRNDGEALFAREVTIQDIEDDLFSLATPPSEPEQAMTPPTEPPRETSA